MVVGPPRRGIRAWLLENYRLLYTLDVIAAYVSLMLHFAALVLIGRANPLSNFFLGVLCVTGFIAAAPFISRGRGRSFEEDFVRTLKFRRSKETERVELMVAAGLWLMIAIAFAIAFFQSAQPHR